MSGGAAPLDGILAGLVDGMAHQVKNPLHAIVVNLELVRLRGRREGEEWERRIEPFAEAIEDAVRLLDRRLGLLVAVARAPDESAEKIPLAPRVRELIGALGWESMAALRVEGDAEEAVVSARPGHLVALLYLVLRALRARASAGEGDGLRLRSRGDDLVLEALGAGGRPPPREERWRMVRLAAAAGGELETEPGGGAWLALSLPRV